MALRIEIGHVDLTQFRVGERDTRELYAVRNHESVRKYMARPEPIPYRSHARWVEENLNANPRLLLFLVRERSGRRAAGLTQLRRPEQHPDAAEIGVMFREPERRRVAAALATAATLHLAFSRLNVERVISYVVPTHTHALAFNRSWAAVEVESDREGMVRLDVTREQCYANPPFRKILERFEERFKIVEEWAGEPPGEP